MTPSVAALASGNLTPFAGAEIVGTIPIRQSLINEALQQATAGQRGRVKEIEIRIGADNLLECAVRVSVGPFTKWFRPQVILTPRILTDRGPVLVLSVAS